MKVLENTSLRLKLEHRPWLAWLSGTIHLLISLWVFIWMIGVWPSSAVLRCDRPNSTQITCNLTQYALLRQVQYRQVFDPVLATVTTHRSSRSRSYEVTLSGPYQTVTVLPDGADSQAIANQINQYLQTPQQSALFIRQNSDFEIVWLLLPTGIAVAFGCWYLFTPSVRCAFYKRMNKVILEQQRLGRKPRTVEYQLEQIRTVELDERRDGYGARYRPCLVLRGSGEEERVPLRYSFTKHKTASAIQTVIQDFLRK